MSFHSQLDLNLRVQSWNNEVTSAQQLLSTRDSTCSHILSRSEEIAAAWQPESSKLRRPPREPLQNTTSNPQKRKRNTKGTPSNKCIKESPPNPPIRPHHPEQPLFPPSSFSGNPCRVTRSIARKRAAIMSNELSPSKRDQAAKRVTCSQSEQELPEDHFVPRPCGQTQPQILIHPPHFSPRKSRGRPSSSPEKGTIVLPPSGEFAVGV